MMMFVILTLDVTVMLRVMRAIWMLHGAVAFH